MSSSFFLLYLLIRRLHEVQDSEFDELIVVVVEHLEVLLHLGQHLAPVLVVVPMVLEVALEVFHLVTVDVFVLVVVFY